MAEQLPTNQVSISDLKNRIAHYERKLKADSTDELYAERRYDALALAWRAAFEWRNQERFDMVTPLQTPNMAEYAEGMALIREKLR